MSSLVELAVRGTADFSDVTTGMDKVGDASRAMADEVERAARTADNAVDRMGNIADASDNLDSKAAAATGSLGALSSGFELVGAEKYAVGLQNAALATDFLSGVGQSLKLVMDLQAVATLRAKAATVAQGIAARVTAAGQWALNAAMSANPVMLVVLAIIALVAIFVIAYKRSETFRDAVDAAGRVGREAIGWIVDRAQDAIDIAGKLIGWFKDRIPGALETLGDKARRIGDILLAPFKAVQEAIEKILDLISKIDLPDLPDLPDLNPFNGRGPGDGPPAPAGGAGGGSYTFNFYGFYGDRDALVDTIVREIGRDTRLVGAA